MLTPVIALGIILGLYELFAIHSDLNFRGSHWMGHGVHSIVLMMIALFAVFNWGDFLQITTLAQKNIPFISLNSIKKLNFSTGSFLIELMISAAILIIVLVGYLQLSIYCFSPSSK